MFINRKRLLQVAMGVANADSGIVIYFLDKVFEQVIFR